MGILDGLALGLGVALMPLNFSLILVGSLIGILIGILPGLRPIHGVSVLMPISYAIGLSVETMLIFLVSIYCGTVCGTRASGLLFEPETGCGEDIGPLLALSTVSSFTGGLVAVLGLILSVILLQLLAVRFNPAEYFALVVFAIASLSVRAGTYPLRTLASTCIGLMMATVGIDSTTGVLRFAFGQPELYDGIEFTTVVIGLFAISRVFVFFDENVLAKAVIPNIKRMFLDRRQISIHRWLLLRASLAGFLVGLFPGAGTSIASSFSSSIEHRLVPGRLSSDVERSKRIMAEETANSAAVGGALVPMLVLGIPGSGTTAILLGSLLLYNITPGPTLFIQHADIIWSIIASMGVGSLILLLINLLFIRYFIKVSRTPNWLFVPCFIVLAFIGGFSVNGSSFSLLLLILIGGFGYLLEKFEYPLIPLLVGFVLGDLMEDNLRRALAISGGEIDTLFASPISISLFTLSLVVVVLPLVWKRLKRKHVS